MTTITFDKLAYIEHLKTAGINEAEARAHAFALDDALKESVATKGDVSTVRTDLEKARSDLEARLRELELRMTIKVGGMLFVAVGVILTVMRLMLGKGL
jgi:hypothetical protein